MLGIDQSLSSTGYAYSEGGERLTFGRITTKDQRGSVRLFYIRNRLHEIVEKVRPSLVVFEGYAMGFGRSTGRLADLGELGGVLKLYAWERGLDVLVVPPSTLKLAVVGRGNAKKEEMAIAVRRSYGYDVAQDDEADAVGLALIGWSRMGVNTLKLSHRAMEAVANCDLHEGRISLK